MSLSKQDAETKQWGWTTWLRMFEAEAARLNVDLRRVSRTAIFRHYTDGLPVREALGKFETPRSDATALVQDILGDVDRLREKVRGDASDEDVQKKHELSDAQMEKLRGFAKSAGISLAQAGAKYGKHVKKTYPEETKSDSTSRSDQLDRLDSACRGLSAKMDAFVRNGARKDAEYGRGDKVRVRQNSARAKPYAGLVGRIVSVLSGELSKSARERGATAGQITVDFDGSRAMFQASELEPA